MKEDASILPPEGGITNQGRAQLGHPSTDLVADRQTERAQGYLNWRKPIKPKFGIIKPN
jgi:hypothetical protein